MTEPDLDADRPAESSEADVTLVARGITVTACVELSRTSAVVVRPARPVCNCYPASCLSTTAICCSVSWPGSPR